MSEEKASYVYERRIDPELAGPFAKHPEREDFLERLNAWLVLHADAEHLRLEETVPTLHVIGAPRSGTTLLHQALISRLELGYVDNLVAAFWRAPTYGVQLSRSLRIGEQQSSFEVVVRTNEQCGRAARVRLFLERPPTLLGPRGAGR